MFPVVRKDAGFSLIELAILLTIVGLMAATALQEYRQYSVTKDRNDTFAHRDVVEQAMVRFLYNYHRLPCPADPSLAPSAAQAGYEQCMTGTGQTAVDYCSGAVCRRVGFRHTDDGGTDVSIKDNILIGGVPYATIGVPISQAVDGWGGKYVYAISEYLTRQGSGAAHSGTYNDQYGTINLKQYQASSNSIENTFNPDILPAPTIAGAYMMAIVSLGQDRKGAYAYNGGLIKPCTGTALDVENCNGDATFLSPDLLYNTVPGASYYDDPFVDTKLVLESDKWKYASTTGIRNKTNNKVGIGTAAPAYPLEVDGNILVDGNYYADNYCTNDSTAACFPLSVVFGDHGISCGDTGVVDKIGRFGSDTTTSSSFRHCFNSLASMPAFTCPFTPTQQYIVGFDSTGKPICAVPPVPTSP